MHAQHGQIGRKLPTRGLSISPRPITSAKPEHAVSASFRPPDHYPRARSSRESELKEYSIGVEVLERPETFDPRTDPAVRLEARRLRLKLAEYYQHEGREDSVVIDLPKEVATRRRSDSSTPPVAARAGGGPASRGAAQRGISPKILMLHRRCRAARHCRRRHLRGRARLRPHVLSPASLAVLRFPGPTARTPGTQLFRPDGLRDGLTSDAGAHQRHRGHRAGLLRQSRRCPRKPHGRSPPSPRRYCGLRQRQPFRQGHSDRSRPGGRAHRQLPLVEDLPGRGLRPASHRTLRRLRHRAKPGRVRGHPRRRPARKHRGIGVVSACGGARPNADAGADPRSRAPLRSRHRSATRFCPGLRSGREQLPGRHPKRGAPVEGVWRRLRRTLAQGRRTRPHARHFEAGTRRERLAVAGAMEMA